MKRGNLIFKFAAILGVLATASFSYAAIPHALRSSLMTDFSFARSSANFSKGLDISLIQPIESNRVTSADISKIIPSNMEPTSNGSLVAAQILDHSLSNWFNSEEVRNSDIGRRAHQVEKSMEGDVSFGGAEPNSIKHQFKFQVKATQTQAQLAYSGLTSAQVTYYVLQDKTNFEIREPMKALNTQIVYNHIVSHDETRKMVSLRWNW